MESGVTKREMLRFGDPAVLIATQGILDIASELDPSDSRAKLKACEIILDHNKDLYKHENPSTQKIEHSGTISIAQQIIAAYDNKQ